MIFLAFVFCLSGFILYSAYMYGSVIKIYSVSNYISKGLFFIRDYLVYKCRDKYISTFESGKIEFNEKSQIMELTYYKNSVRYKIAIPVKKGLRPIKNISFKHDGTNDEILEENKKAIENIKEFMGPYGNFHGIPLTPNMLNVNKSLMVTYRNNFVREYNPDEIIELTIPVNPTK